MSDRVIIWGCGSIYNQIINQIILLEQLGKIIRVAVACKEPLPLSHIDGVRRIRPEELRYYEYNYVIVAINDWRQVFLEAEDYGIPEEKLILGTAFRIPLFDWDRYIRIKTIRPSIVSDTCWGGAVFDRLGLQYYSPFVGLFWEAVSYKKFLMGLKDYLAMEAVANMEYVASRGGIMPVLRFVGDEEICAYAPHLTSPEDLLNKWNRRKKRFNYNFFLVKMQIFTQEDLMWFNAFSTPYKVGFCGFDQVGENLVRIPAWDISEERKNFAYDMKRMIHETIQEGYPAKTTEVSYDIFKLLCGEKDYNRCL